MSSYTTIIEDWEEVYSVQDVPANIWTEGSPFLENTKYYQTFGGGPEGGYFVKGDQIWEVKRSLFQKWQYELLENTCFEYEAEDEMAGKTARCRLIKVTKIESKK